MGTLTGDDHIDSHTGQSQILHYMYWKLRREAVDKF